MSIISRAWNSLKDRFRLKHPTGRCLACFHSAGHPVCWRTHLLDTNGSTLPRIQLPLQLPLDWYWASRHLCPDPHCSLTGRERHLTSLTSETASMLLTDLSEIDDDGYGREVILIGAEEGRLPSLDVMIEVKKFLALERSSVRAVLLHLEDDPCDYLYFQYQDYFLFEAKMDELGIHFRDCNCYYSYSRLHTAALDVRLDTLRDLLITER